MRPFHFWLTASVLILALQGVSSAQEIATWTDVTGEFQIAAEFCGVREGKVFLKNQDGKFIAVPIGKLNEASRTQAKKHYFSMPTIGGSGQTLNLSENRPPDFDVPPIQEAAQDDIKPRYDRWVVQIRASRLSELAALYDAFHIEIGVIGGDYKGVQSINHLSAGRPHVLTEMDPAKETRMYFMNIDNSELVKMQRQLAEKAGARRTDAPCSRLSPRHSRMF